MRAFVSILLAMGIASPALAQGSTCNAEAVSKKLSGAAKTEFIRQCEVVARQRMALAAKADKKASTMSVVKDEHCGHIAASDL